MSEIKLIQLNNYVKPKLEENKSKNWVLNGRNNEFYQYIIDRFNGSVTNHAVITAYSNLIYGQGLFAKDSNLKITDWVRFKSMLPQKELRKIISDYELFGEASLQIIKSKDRKSVTGIYHLPKQYVVPALENEDGEIESYWYNKNWKKPNDAVPYPAFGTSNEEIEIYCIKPYSAGKNYFSDPDYLASLQYAEMEEEISNFYNNFLRNGLSAGYIINVPDGQSMTPEEKDDLERQIKAKLTGSPNAGKFVLNFASKDAEITVIPFPTNENMHKQWEFLSNEARQQIMTGHLLTSPMLVGIKDNTGLGNNANELDEAESQLLKRVIAPKQIHIIEALDEILAFNDMAFDFYFKALSEVDKAVLPTQLSEEKKKSDLDLFIDLGEDENIDGYELISVKEVDYDEEDALTLSTSTGVARPNAKSKFDTDFYIYRYRYAGNQNPEREFCKRMILANKIYRREDIEAMGEKNVNPGFGMHPTPNNPYSIWKFKGGGLLSAKFTGGTCKHYWEKLTYRKKGVKVDVNNPLAERTESRASGIAGIAPHDI
jgi:hypothetical protein